MPTMTVYRHGVTCGLGNEMAKPPERTEVTGWSSSAIRRNLRFLYSVDERGLEGLPGVAFTLTVKDCPPSGEEWGRLRDNLFRELRREGAVVVHWVTEWQRRGVPHLHLAIFFPPGHPLPVSEITAHWCRIAGVYGPSPFGQHFSSIWDVLGWNQYVSKHAARGLKHYQRSPENIPEGWRGQSTGRMWGKLGTWPVVQPLSIELDSGGFWAYRRIVRGWRVADARSQVERSQDRSKGLRRLRAARRMLRCPGRQLSSVRGLSEWLPESANLAVLPVLQALGHRVESV